jgi:hypothetical protein
MLFPKNKKRLLSKILPLGAIVFFLIVFLNVGRPGEKSERAEGKSQKKESLEEIFSRKLAYTRSSPFYRELHTPHTRRFLPKPWRAEPGEELIDESWSLNTAGRLEVPGPFALEELRTFFWDSGKIRLEDGRGEKTITLQVAGEPQNRTEADSYSLKISGSRIEIESRSWRGILYGVYYLEELLLERGIPAVKPVFIRRRPAFDIRMFGDVYGTFTVSGLRLDRPVSRDTFSALSRFGANATFTFVQLGDYLDGKTFPELNCPDREKNLEELARLAEMAKSAGVDLYLDAYNPKLTDSHPVFLNHPRAKGATQHGGNIRCLCPSDPETLKLIADSWADVFRRVPSLGGMLAIIGGEGFYHCYMRSGKDGPDCPRCRNRLAEDVVADLANAVFRAIRRVKPDAEFLAWPYSAFIWSKEPFQLDLISRLDPGIRLVSEIDKDYLYQKDGYVKNIWDYSIDFLGPSGRFKAQSEASRKRGLNLCCKTETAVSLEMNGVPYLPCLQRWGERLEIIRRERPDSIIYAYDITGFARSRPEELAGRLSWDAAGTADEEIRKIARRDFGPDAAPAVIEAWKFFSEALGHCPHLTHGYYQGPSFIGPGQPLMLSEEGIPPELFGRLFYLAEVDLSEGTAQAAQVRPIYTSRIEISPAEMADMDKAAALWDKGVEALLSVQNKVPEPFAREFERERDMACYLQTVFRSIANANHFFSLRSRFEGLIKDRDKVDVRRDEALQILDEMSAIANKEVANAREGLAIARRDPRLDLAVRLDLDYQPLTKIIEAKIRYMEKSVAEQLAAARDSLAR